MKPEQLEIARLKREVVKLKAAPRGEGAFEKAVFASKDAFRPHLGISA
jgi:hypothetical protein